MPHEMPKPDPQAIQAVIDKELSEVTDADVDSLILYFRQERADFAIAEASGKGARGAKAKLKSPASPATTADVDDVLGDLL